MTDKITDHSVAGTAKDNIPTDSNPMDNIHGTTEDISNKASGYKVLHPSRSHRLPHRPHHPPFSYSYSILLLFRTCAKLMEQQGNDLEPKLQR